MGNTNKAVRLHCLGLEFRIASWSYFEPGTGCRLVGKYRPGDRGDLDCFIYCGPDCGGALAVEL